MVNIRFPCCYIHQFKSSAITSDDTYLTNRCTACLVVMLTDSRYHMITSREEASSVVSSNQGAPSTLSKSILEAWSSLPSDVRAALVSSETSTTSSSVTARESMSSMSTKSSVTSDEDEGQFEFDEECDNGAVLKMRPLERAPKNVFEFTKTHELETTDVKKTASAMVTTKTTIVTTSRGWRNIFALPISYDVNIVPHGTLLDPSNPQLLDSTGVHPEGYNRRFAVIDSAVYGIYGVKIRYYFTSRNVELHFVVLEGGERAKRPDVSSRKSIRTKLFDVLLSCFLNPIHSCHREYNTVHAGGRHDFG